jgi:hypothetical protein
MFGSAGHRVRPLTPVIAAYRQRAARPNVHIKSFVQPSRAEQCRNSHSWFYHPVGTAVSEHGHRIFGSLNLRPTADIAWINHYYCKSEQDYLEKAARHQTQDRVAILFPTRRAEYLETEMRKNNEVLDSCAADYYRARCEAVGRRPILLEGLVAERTAG